jgi:hypothetical protein
MIWWSGLVVSSSPATEEAGAMGREIESLQGMHREVVFLEKKLLWYDTVCFVRPN